MLVSFTDPLLAGLCKHGCPVSERFRCSPAVRRRYIFVLNSLRGVPTLTELLELPHLTLHLVDCPTSLVCVDVTSVYRLEFTCHQADGMLTGITVSRLFPI